MLKKNAMTLAMLVAGTTFVMPAMGGAELPLMLKEEVGLARREEAPQEEAIRAEAQSDPCAAVCQGPVTNGCATCRTTNATPQGSGPCTSVPTDQLESCISNFF